MKIKKLDLKDPATRKEFVRILARVQRQFKPLSDRIRESSRLRSGDMEVRINTRDD